MMDMTKPLEAPETRIEPCGVSYAVVFEVEGREVRIVSLTEHQARNIVACVRVVKN